MNLDFTAADLLPEFECAQELVNGVRYVVAQHGPDEYLQSLPTLSRRNRFVGLSQWRPGTQL